MEDDLTRALGRLAHSVRAVGAPLREASIAHLSPTDRQANLDVVASDLLPAVRGPSPLLRAAGVFPGAERLDGAVTSQGFTVHRVSPDGTGRRAPLFVRLPAGALPSFPVQLARAASGVETELDLERTPRATVAGHEVPLEPDGEILLDPVGPAGTFPTVPATDVLAGSVPPDTFADRIVLLGVTGVFEVAEVLWTPFGFVSTVEYQAAVVENLLAGRAHRRGPGVRLVDLALLVLAGALLSTLLPRVSPADRRGAGPRPRGRLGRGDLRDPRPRRPLARRGPPVPPRRRRLDGRHLHPEPVMIHRFEISTDLAAPPERIWDHAMSWEGVNFELGPWMRMIPPPGLDLADLTEEHQGQPLGRSWILALGVLPVSRVDMMFSEAVRGRRFPRDLGDGPHAGVVPRADPRAPPRGSDDDHRPPGLGGRRPGSRSDHDLHGPPPLPAPPPEARRALRIALTAGSEPRALPVVRSFAGFPGGDRLGGPGRQRFDRAGGGR